MRYELIADSDGVELRSDGEVIYQKSELWSPKDEDILSAILDDADFGQPQTDALKAAFGLMDVQSESP